VSIIDRHRSDQSQPWHKTIGRTTKSRMPI